MTCKKPSGSITLLLTPVWTLPHPIAQSPNNHVKNDFPLCCRIVLYLGSQSLHRWWYIHQNKCMSRNPQCSDSLPLHRSPRWLNTHWHLSHTQTHTHEVSHSEHITTTGIFCVSDATQCLHLCRMFHPPAPDQWSRRSCRNRWCWCIGLPDTHWGPRIHSHLNWHISRRHQHDTFTASVNHRVSLWIYPTFAIWMKSFQTTMNMLEKSCIIRK